MKRCPDRWLSDLGICHAGTQEMAALPLYVGEPSSRECCGTWPNGRVDRESNGPRRESAPFGSGGS